MPHISHHLDECFAHLSHAALFDGACFIEPPRHDSIDRVDFCIGQIGFIQGRGYQRTLDLFHLSRSAVAKGFLMERMDHESAVYHYCIARGNGR